MASEAPASSFARTEGGRLRERVAIVTGGGRGIGRAIALGLAAEGATVVVISRSEEELDAVVADAESLGGGGLALVVDCMDGPALKRAVGEARERLGRLDILFNNVGGLVGEAAKLTALEHDDELFEQNLFLNLTSAYYATRAALPHMVAGGYGRVVGIGSGYAIHGGGMISYSAAKHGLVGFTRALAYQVPPQITVNCLCPGWTDTALLDWGGARDGLAAATVKTEALTVQGRVLAPAELAPMATLLAGPEGAGITGQVISVDGGYKV
ncbi:MAG: SDR family NAD(P)-dependent oxidoreductase [Solirubrobacterales bacterium]